MVNENTEGGCRRLFMTVAGGKTAQAMACAM